MESQNQHNYDPGNELGLGEFDSVGLRQIKSVSLQNRKDIKFATHARQLPILIRDAQKDHFVFEQEGNRFIPYENIYFDTPDLKCYLDHHNGNMSRYKFRYRRYSDSGITFFEVKIKNNKGRTIKHRLADAVFQDSLEARSAKWVTRYTPFNPEEMRASLAVNFNRITLVDRKFRSRSTIDVNLKTYIGNSSFDFENAVVIEVKQNAYDRSVPMQQLLHKMGIREFRMSKYCMGTLNCRQGVKTNRFKEKQLRLHKITNPDNG